MKDFGGLSYMTVFFKVTRDIAVIRRLHAVCSSEYPFHLVKSRGQDVAAL